jgi:hypothetical protein
MHTTWRRPIAALVATLARAGGLPVLALAAAPLSAQTVSYTGSVQGATGRYIFTAPTASMSLTTGLAVDAGRFRLSASVPFIYQDQPWVTHSGAGPLPTGGPQHRTVADSTSSGRWRRHRGAIPLDAATGIDEVGIGDPMAFVDLDVFNEGAMRPAMRVSAAVKAPIADADAGFGTGEWDLAGGLGLSKSLGRAMLLADGSYWALGDMPDLDLRDVFAYAAALAVPMGRGPLTGLAGFSGATAAIAGTRPPVQIVGALSYRWLNGGWTSAGLSVGLTNTAPDVTGTISWQVPLSGAPRVIAGR